MNKKIIVDSCDNLYKDKNWKFDLNVGPRDVYTNKIVTEWLNAYNISRKDTAFIPAEIAYLDYNPKITKTRLFGLHHTTGLSCGSSIEEASLNGIFEVLERDAYWNVMRTRMRCPDIDLNEVDDLDSKVLEMVDFLDKKGLKVVVKDFSLDWDLAIAHVMIISKNGKIPAFTHGSGASFTWSSAITRAVTEAVQMYSGLCDVADKMWDKIVCVKDVVGNSKLSWSDPLMAPQLEHLYLKSEKKWKKNIKFESVDRFISDLFARGHECIVASLGSIYNLEVVRVVITGVTEPDERLERVGFRLKKFAKSEGIDEKGLYNDPILT